MTGGRVVGVDVGGTSSRALAMTLDGTPLGRGSAGGGNPNSHPPDLAAKRVAEAVRDALAPGGGEVRGCLLGLAGESKFTDPTVVDTFTSALRQVGIAGPISVLSDAEVAFAAGTGEPDGTVVISGTGAVAARIAGHRKTSWVDGWGWLLGDEGSAYWIGREAVRTTLRQLQAGEPPSPLAEAVLVEALPSLTSVAEPRVVNRLITAANAEAPVRLARFASMVSTCAATDPAAAGIVARAADLLAGLAVAARPAGDSPIVLAGSVIGPDSPVGVALRAALAELTPAPVLFATDGAAGAAWLAALEVVGPDAPRPRTRP
ncbi:N-acetylglucosamine kinase [Actinophytocola sp.]|uniref:N-acetylglucosamine kinase n=1 Tax=Actinophytocola sp. TaxID=1872138 RepID=UPI002EDA3130